ncbi:MAG TPA: 50S ribosomal protein L15 [Candidatus Latescibacteria bacterium]|nr:50S ribosomal protein L15 [Gemmatimonadota bacterium]MEE3040496.1 50S ribosomal protein L15 [Candidatus Latescibacterota bacterium]HCV23827.1 50S ribosomal protein L15 [Candidatus Latescibacterota bacterium]HJN29001.1 50S ribosomal protein L15 [Candidatus Latescibacterota bacterium]|tara:strand:- start:1834 stop:2289 length:456 start_codon:yes stop_codon:yes gene_type:complete
MKLGDLSPAPGSRRTAKRKGKGPGTGNGKTAGRGHKGQRSRSGGMRGSRQGFEGGQMPLHRRLPKIGFSNAKFRTTFQVVNVGEIQKAGLEGDVGPAELAKAGLVRKATDTIKILGDGDLSATLNVRAHAFSKSARAKIEQAGGSAQGVEG